MLEDAGRTVFATYMVLVPGERRGADQYALPAGVAADGAYLLTVQKQAGTEAHPLQVTVEAEGVGPARSVPEPSESSPGRVSFRTDLRTDREFRVGLR